ncbi:MAG: endonuclease/exonuclease/phosphatase family protein [Oligoflexales bacterium]
MHRIVYTALAIFLELQVSVSMAHTLLHANIKDLRSSDIGLNSSQMRALKELVLSKGITPDVVNIQEIQYDLAVYAAPGGFLEGQNLASLLALTWPSTARELQGTSLFVPSNTGMLARRDEAGRYCLSKEPSGNQINMFADQQNFGLFPGQYSSGLVSRFKQLPGEEVKVLKDLKWREFNQKLNLSQFAAGSGEPLNPEIQLFDKVFYSLPVQIDGKLVHLVSLHTVPYFHFGNARTPNYARNYDQLRFLSWYLHGDAQGLEIDAADLWVRYKIKPLPEDAHYVFMGDLNVDIHDRPDSDQSKAYDSAKVLHKIIAKSQIPFDPSRVTFDSGRLQKFFDYVIFSKHFKLSNPRIWDHDKFAKATELSDHHALTVDFFIP